MYLLLGKPLFPNIPEDGGRRFFRNIGTYLPENSLVEEGSNTSTVALRVVGGDETETRCLGV
jgi:hypothetical protein